MYFKHYCTYPFNAFHLDTFNSYQYGKRDVRSAKIAPRGYAKSTIEALIKPIHDIAYKLEKFIVIASCTEPQSVQKLKDISGELITNHNLINDYGNFIHSKKVGSTDFITDNDGFKTRFYAIGCGTEVRGIRFGDARPSKIICDDVEHSTKVESELLREKVEDWYRDVISKIGNEDTNIHFVGTILHEKSLLRGLSKNARYDVGEYKAVISWSENQKLWEEWKRVYNNLDDPERAENAEAFFKESEEDMMKGVKVLWPQKEPYYKLQLEIIETGIRSFMKEKQNSPLSDEEKVFDPDAVQYFTEEDEGIRIESNSKLIKYRDLTGYAFLDPATGQSKATQQKKSDFTCILFGFYHSKTDRLFVAKDYTKRVAPSVFTNEIFNFMDRYEIYRFGIETNLYRNLLLPNILEEKKKRNDKGANYDTKFYDVIQTDNKEKRIYTIEPRVYHGNILFSRGLSGEFFSQLFEFPKGSHDDCPDALEGLWDLCKNRKNKIGGIKKKANR